MVRCASTASARTGAGRRTLRFALHAILPLLAAFAVAQAETPWAALEAALSDAPRVTFDPVAVVDSVGGTPEALFTWVRDEVGLISYRGALKGAVGTLLDRGGNALDRALLLRALLEVAGHDAVLAQATLDRDTAGQVLAATRTPAPGAVAPVADAAALAARAAQELGLDPTTVQGALVRAAERVDARQAKLAADARALDEALAALLPDLPGADALTQVQDHWWVQVRLSDGTWLDLDPTLPDAAPGDRFAEPVHTLAPASIADLAGLDGPCPDLACGDRIHLVRVQAVAEVREDGELVEHVLLDTTLIPAELVGVPVALVFAAGGGDGMPAPFEVIDPRTRLLEALAEHDAWMPRLVVGEEARDGRVVADDGTIRDRLEASGGGPLGGFGGFGLGGGGGSAEDAFTAFWWVFEVREPGVGTATARREVFDLIGPAARAAGAVGDGELQDAVRLGRALALAGETELGAWPAAPDDALLAWLAAQRLLAERDAWTVLERERTALPMDALNERLAALTALRLPTERFILARGRSDARTGEAPQASLALVAHHRRLRPDLSIDQGFDVIAAPPPAAAPSDGPARRAAGVRDAVLEGLLAEGATDRPEGPTVAEAFARSPGTWRLVAAPADLESVATLPADLTARVAVDLTDGYWAVVPTDATDAVGYWRVDPSSGATVAIGPRGWGQAMAGYAERTAVLLQLRSVIHQYASMGKCLGLALVQPLQGVTGVGDELAECAFGMICGAVNGIAGSIVEGEGWLTVIVMNTMDALWGGVPEAGTGGFCGALWAELNR